MRFVPVSMRGLLSVRGLRLNLIQTNSLGRFLLIGFLFGSLTSCAWGQDEKAPTAASSSDDKPSVEEDTGEYKVVDPPPVTRIIMFNSGLSQVFHEGTVEGNRRVNMRFSEHDVDDVLKSLVFEDNSGGVVRSVEYNPAPDNQDVAAESLGPAMTLAQTLQKYRGETVEIQVKDTKLKGSILSVENRQTRDGFVETLTVVNDEGFVSVALSEFDSINFDNEKLRDEFTLAMAGLQKSRLASSKELNLLFEGQAERDVRFSYNVDAPIWRMTYRLEVGEDQSSLQGWAHIDNVTGVDWKNIRLDLRSGRPQSFHADLFAPVLVERMGVGLNVFDLPRDKRLITDEFSRNRGKSGFGGGGFGGSIGGGGFGGAGFGGGTERNTEEFDITSAIRAASSVGRSSKMVRFEIKEPVSLAAGRSAMLPVLTEEIPVKLYTMFDRTRNAAVASMVVQIKNQSQTALIPGPVSLYQNGDFVGDGALGRIEVQQTAELAYGNDLSVSLRVENDSEVVKIDSVRLENDSAVLQKSITQKSTYQFSNNDSLPRNFLLKTSLREEDVQPEPAKRRDNIGYYSVDCAARSNVQQQIVQSRIETEKIALKSVTFSDLKRWRKAGSKIAPALEDAVVKNEVDFKTASRKKFAKWKKDGAKIGDELEARLQLLFEAQDVVTKISEQQAHVFQRISGIQQEQTRIADIIKVLPADSPALTRYLESLARTEKELVDEKENQARIRQDLKAAQDRVAEMK